MRCSHLIPPPTPGAAARRNPARASNDLHREGMTAVKDPAIERRDLGCVSELLREGKLHGARLRVVVRGHHARLGARRAQGDSGAAAAAEVAGRRPRCSLAARRYSWTAAAARARLGCTRTWNKNFTDIDAGNTGYPSTDPDVYRQDGAAVPSGRRARRHSRHRRPRHRLGGGHLRPSARQKRQPSGLRHSIIHANIPTDHAIETMARLQKKYDAGYPEAQAPFIWWIGDTYAGNFGPERSQRLVPSRLLPRQGHPLGRRFGLFGHAAPRALRAVGIGRARNV